MRSLALNTKNPAMLEIAPTNAITITWSMIVRNNNANTQIIAHKSGADGVLRCSFKSLNNGTMLTSKRTILNPDTVVVADLCTHIGKYIKVATAGGAMQSKAPNTVKLATFTLRIVITAFAL